MADAGGGQLDRQRQAVEFGTDRRDRRDVGGVEREVRLGGGPLDEESHRLGPAQGVPAGDGPDRGQRERRDGDRVLTGKAQDLPAGHERRQGGAGGQQAGDHWPRGEQVLEIVQDEQRPAVAQERPDTLLDRLAADLPHAEGVGDARRNQAGYSIRVIADRGEGHEPDAVREAGGGDGDGQAGVGSAMHGSCD